MNNNIIVVTGIGVVSSLGIGHQALWENLVGGKSGISRITRFDTSDLMSHNAGWIQDFDPKDFIQPSMIRRMDWPTRLIAVATELAIEDANLHVGEGMGDDIGLILNTTFGPVSTNQKYLLNIIEHGPREASPMLFPNTVTNAAAGYIAQLHKLRGVSSVILGASSIAYAFDMIRSGRADCIIAGGFEELSEVTYRLSSKMGFLATETNELTEDSFPFHTNRNGFVLGEGAAVVVLESRRHAIERGANIYCELASYGTVFDPSVNGNNQFRSVDPDLLTYSIQNALVLADCNPGEIDAVIALALGTQDIDSAEAKSLKTVFSGRCSDLPLYAIKAKLGETVGAANAFAVVCASLSIARGIIPSSNYYHYSELQRPIVCSRGDVKNPRAILCNSLELSGNIDAFVVRKLNA